MPNVHVTSKGNATYYALVSNMHNSESDMLGNKLLIKHTFEPTPHQNAMFGGDVNANFGLEL